MNKTKSIFAALVIMFGVTLAPAAIGYSTASAAPKDELCKGIGGCDAPGSASLDSMFKKIVNILLYIIGAVSVLMIVIGGVRYVVSGGDQSAVKGAKDTILYAIIGIVVAFMAYAIVNWVIKNL